MDDSIWWHETGAWSVQPEWSTDGASMAMKELGINSASSIRLPGLPLAHICIGFIVWTVADPVTQKLPSSSHRNGSRAKTTDHILFFYFIIIIHFCKTPCVISVPEFCCSNKTVLPINNLKWFIFIENQPVHPLPLSTDGSSELVSDRLVNISPEFFFN